MSNSKIIWPDDLRPGNSPIFTHNELHIPAEPHIIWAWLVRAELWPTWYANCSNLTILSGSGPDLQLGTKFTWTTFGVQVETVVEEFELFGKLAWRGGGLGAQGYHAWLIEVTTNGCLVTTEEVQIGLIPSLGRFFLRRSLLREHQNWLEGLAARAQKGLPPTPARSRL